MIQEFFNDFKKFHEECPVIELNQVAKIGDKYTYKYADLGIIMKIVKPLLHKNNFLVYWITKEDGTVICLLEHKSGKSISSELKIGDTTEAKTQGANITYARRYTISALLGILTSEDADAPPNGDKKGKKLNKKSYESALARIENGENGLYDKVRAEFDCTEEQMEGLTNAHFASKPNIT